MYMYCNKIDSSHIDKSSVKSSKVKLDEYKLSLEIYPQGSGLSSGDINGLYIKSPQGPFLLTAFS